jgi:transcriptional regulator with XRE-family HTH domain
MVGEALRLIRVFHDRKQTEVADKLGISKSYLSEIERGDKIPTLPVIQKYAAEFDLPVSSIMFFAESLDQKTSLSKARKVVAPKIIRLMKFLEARMVKGHANNS